MDMTSLPLNCPNCNAPRTKKSLVCEYCGTILSDTPRVKNNSIPLTVYPDFGIKSIWPIYIALLGAAILYAIGWTQENIVFLLSVEASIIWAGIIPLWLAFFAFTWQTAWGEWLPGFAVAIPEFGLHLIIIYIFTGRVNDDAVGIAAMFAASALGGWSIGRALHNTIRRIKGQAQQKT